MYLALVNLTERYEAQNARWDSLWTSIKDKRASTPHVHDSGDVVRIRLSGSVKEETGATLKSGPRIWLAETLARRSLGIRSYRVHSEIGAYLRAEWKQQSSGLKFHPVGTPRTVGQAREMIKNTLTLVRHSVGFFLKQGIQQQLKETLLEKITIKHGMLSIVLHTSLSRKRQWRPQSVTIMSLLRSSYAAVIRTASPPSAISFRQCLNRTNYLLGTPRTIQALQNSRLRADLSSCPGWRGSSNTPLSV